MKLKFKASEKMIQYNGVFSVKDGDVTPDIPETNAGRLLASWPDNFSKLGKAPKLTDTPGPAAPIEHEDKEELETEKDKDDEKSKKSLKDKVNKMLGGGKDK